MALPKSKATSDQGSAPGPCGENLHPVPAEEGADWKKSADVVDELAGGVAHEFNNIFASIRLSAELLQDQLGNDDRRLRTLVRATSRGASVTQKLLAFSRQQRLSPCVLDLGAFVEGMIGPLIEDLGESIRVEFRQAPDLWPVNADPVQLRNVIFDLAGNARDAMPLGGRLVIEMANVRLGPKHDATDLGLVPGDYVMLAVSDTGHGIGPQILEHVFEPFFTTKDVGEGSGLGLSVVHGIIGRHDGAITVQSRPGEGTCFDVFLPRAEPLPELESAAQ